jgi:SAM-dependent methyltransferase
MGALSRFRLDRLVADHQVTHLIETGYGEGGSCKAALEAGFQQALSCEIFAPLHARAVQGPQLQVMLADSLGFLQAGSTAAALRSHRCLVFLDAHYPGADHAGQSYRDTTRPAQERLPLMAEIAAIHGQAANALVVIDDVRIYRRDFKVAQGANPDWAENAWDQEAGFVALLESFAATHSLHWYGDDTGYAVLWPLAWGAYDLHPWVLPGDQTGSPELQLGVPGTTSTSLNRRLQDARFGNRWLVGQGIDIGGGPDSIGLYKGLFPRMQSVTVYDWAQGDAQYLANVHDASFDFVYSAHCLEHVVDPRIALRHWLRVLKPGGYMVVTVPDEDLYEQGVWPSTFNDDHKHSFTIFKRNSWSPVSINVLELLQSFDAEVGIEKIEQLNHTFLPGYVRFDQTRTAFSECGIEIVLKKL